MRYLLIFFASLVLVGCAQSTGVEPVAQESGTQSQEESAQSADTDSSEDAEQKEPEQAVEDEETYIQEPGVIEGESAESDSTEENTGGDQSNDNEQVEIEEPVEEQVEEEAAEEQADEPQAEPTGFTMAMVSENDDASSCWSVINGNVYDLTDWINRHPGGSQRILSLCGGDGSASFNSMHQGQSNPESRLQSFLLGPLS